MRLVVMYLIMYAALVVEPQPEERLDAASITDVLSAAAANQNSIKSYEFSGNYRDTGKLSSGIDRQFWYRQSGDNFRMESHPLRLEDREKSTEVISAYNGQQFQQFYPQPSLLTFSVENRFPSPYMELNPLCIPYFWVSEKPFQNWSKLQSPEMWQNIAKSARIVRRERVSSAQCVVIELNYPTPLLGTDGKLEVFLAQDCGYFPIRVQSLASSIQNHGKVEVNILDHQTIASDGRSVVMPTQIEWIEHDVNGELINNKKWVIEPNSIKVNTVFPEEIFTLSPSMAKTVDDYDFNMKRYIEEGIITPASQPIESRRNYSIWLAANLVAIVVLMLAFIVRKYGKHADAKVHP